MKPQSPALFKPAVVDFDAPGVAIMAEKRVELQTTLSQLPYVSRRVLAMGSRVLDALAMVGLGVANAAFYPGYAIINNPETYFAIAVISAILLVVLNDVFKLYQLNRLLSPAASLPSVVTSWALLFVGLIAAAFLLKAGNSISRLWLANWALNGLFFMVAVRFLFVAFLRRLNHNGQLNRRAVLVGGGEAAARVMAALEGSHDTGISLVGVFDDRIDGRDALSKQALPRLGRIEDLIDFVRATRIDTLIITLPVPAEERLMQILNRLWVLPVEIRLSAQGQKLRYRPRAYSYIGNLPCLDIFDKPLGEFGPLLKSITDKMIAGLALVLLAPAMIAIAFAVKLTSPGPVLFMQKRYGFNNELIAVYKFRSMYSAMADVNAEKLTTRGDPRVTPVGRIIRRTSLDELPQLFNVLKGSLSLVGPRPHATKAKAGEMLYEHAVDGYFARHKVKPGITGWAQINGWRGETDTAEKIERRVEHDLYYIDNWSLTFDLYILARTPLALLTTKNAF